SYKSFSKIMSEYFLARGKDVKSFRLTKKSFLSMFKDSELNRVKSNMKRNKIKIKEIDDVITLVEKLK
ncbi:MAG: hypothetical protein AB8G22_14585, partial [Saprospiraceae bacterium]